MSFVGLSDDFELDDDGILRDSMNGTELLMDDEGILREDMFGGYRHEVRGPWTDSGFSGDKQSTTSTLQQLQNSFEDLAPIGDESINISELEASKDDLSFERQENDFDMSAGKQGQHFPALGFLDTMESTLEKPLDEEDDLQMKQNKKFSNAENPQKDMFPPEYYQQLRELGVLVDGVDLSRDSLSEFEEVETKADYMDKEDKEHDDLIAEYLASEYRKEEEEQGGRQKRKIIPQQTTSKAPEHFSRASSAQTISSRSFPDEAEDFAYDSLSQNLGSQTQSQKTVGDDEEILNITSKIVHRGSADNTHILGGNVNSSFHGSSSNRRDSMTTTGRGFEEEDPKSAFSESVPHYSRPASATSHYSTASDLVQARQKRAEEIATQRMFRARSQEELPQKLGDRGQQKRLLPTMSSSEPSHSFKTKSKSVSNIAGKSGPVKPTHMTVSEISQYTDVEGQQLFPWEDITSKSLPVESESAGELSTRLTQEAQKRKQATELVQQLQKDYDNLLTKYALAELTIDQMRLGAKITIHADSPTPLQAHSGVMSPVPAGQSGQLISVRQSPSHALKISAMNSVGRSSPLKADAIDQTDGRPTFSQEDQRSRSRPDLLKGSYIGVHQSIAEAEDGFNNSPETGTETVQADMFRQARDMDERLETFHSLLEQRHLTLEEQEKVLENIKADHETLRRGYLQAKDDYNVLRRSGAITTETQNFDENKELEGHLFRLGMRFDEVQEKVEKNLKEKPIQRKPFSTDSNRATEDKKMGNTSKADWKEDDRDNRRTNDHGHPLNASRNQSVDSTDDVAFEQRIQELKSEYNTGMDLYRKLKYTADTPEGSNQIDRVVKKLGEICTEMPEMFRLSPEIQSRWERISQRDPVKSQRNSPLPHSSRNGPLVGRHRHGSEHSDSDSSRARFGGSTRSSLGSILPDRMDHPQYQSRNATLPNSIPNGRHSPGYVAGHDGHGGFNPGEVDRPPSRSRSRRSSGIEDNNSFSDRSFHANDTSNTTLPRPRKHAHELKDPKLSKLPETQSFRDTSSGRVPDSTRGQSHDYLDSGPRGASGGGRASHGGAGIGEDTEGALAALPGPGKFKQMTKQRASDDADSGFIGSMVGSGVGEPPAVVQEQRERALVLRKPADESSTITDSSFDRSSHTSGGSRTKNKSHRRREARRRGQSSGSSQRDASFDEEEDTLETLDSEVSSRSGRQAKSETNRRNRERQKKDAGLDKDKSTESDQSTPRAVKQTPAVKNKETTSTSQSTHQQQQTPVQLSNKPDSVRQPSVSTSTSATQVKVTFPEAKKNAEQGVHHQTSPSSLPQHNVPDSRPGGTPVPNLGSRSTSPSRPCSRGSPTTDLMHTRSRRISVGSGRHFLPETDTAHRDLEMREERVQLSRQSQQTAQSQGISTGVMNLPPAGEEPLLLPHEIRKEGMTKRGKEYEERSVGSDVEVGSSITTRASSVNSNIRLKALQEEIEKLKEGFARANERPSHPPPPPQIFHVPAPQLPTAEGKQEPEYYDPFDDPYGFMRMPRRRANSFSGGRERDWDEWYWTLPQNRQYDGGDIPLGYAAADAYADPRIPGSRSRDRNTKETVRNRLRQKRLERKVQGEVPPAAETEPVGASGEALQPPAPGVTAAAAVDEAALYNYYLPSRFSTEAMRQQMASRGYFTTPSGGKIYSSTGEEADNEDERGVFSDTGYRQSNAVLAQTRPWYQIKRSQRPSTAQNMGAVRAQSQGDIRHEPQRSSTAPYFNTQVQGRPPTVPMSRSVSQTCPICGILNYHTHPSYVHRGPPAYSSPPPYPSDTVRIDHSPIRLSRQRSRSAQRSRSYASDSTYRIREYSRLSNSDDEDLEEGEERRVRRSRSLSRGRNSLRSRAGYARRRSTSASDISGDEDDPLDRSLSLSTDITKLTHKMLGTLKSELVLTRRQRDYGSTYW